MIKDTYKYKLTEIALYIWYLLEKGKYVTSMTKIQKLLYITYARYMVRYGERLIDEYPHKWSYCPVFPACREYLLKGDYEDPDLDYRTIKFVKQVIEDYASYSGDHLSELTQDKAWDKSYIWDDVIPDNFIYKLTCY